MVILAVMSYHGYDNGLSDLVVRHKRTVGLVISSLIKEVGLFH